MRDRFEGKFTAAHSYRCAPVMMDGEKVTSSSDGLVGALNGSYLFKTEAAARRAGRKRPSDARKGSKVKVTIQKWLPGYRSIVVDRFTI